MTVICGCAVCGGDIKEGDAMADHKVTDIEGNLDYIELAHLDCGKAENAARGRAYWEHDDAPTVSPIEQARANARAYQAAYTAHLFRNEPEPNQTAFGYRHGWYSVGAESFCLEQLFPNEHHPRFPADQGTSD